MKEELVERYTNYIINEYIKSGGKKEDADRDLTYWALRGIFEREGENGLRAFIDSWKPHITKPRVIGYAGI